MPCPPPGALSNPRIKPRSPALWANSLPSEPPRKRKNTGVGSLSFLQGIFPTQGLNPGLPHCRWILYQLSYQEDRETCQSSTQIRCLYCHLISSVQFSRSVVSDSVKPHGLQPARLLCPWGFSRQEYWSGLPCPPPGDLPNPGTEPRSPTLQSDSLPSEPQRKPCNSHLFLQLSASKQQQKLKSGSFCKGRVDGIIGSSVGLLVDVH